MLPEPSLSRPFGLDRLRNPGLGNHPLDSHPVGFRLLHEADTETRDIAAKRRHVSDDSCAAARREPAVFGRGPEPALNNRARRM